MKTETRNSKPGSRNSKFAMLWILLFAAFPMLGNAAEGYKLVCDKPVYHFGTVDVSAVVTNVFTIRNEGDLTYPHKYVRTSCGCTRGRISSRMIGPGETAEISVVFKAAGRKGKQNKRLWVMPMNSNTPALVLTLKGVVGTNSPVIRIEAPE